MANIKRRKRNTIYEIGDTCVMLPTNNVRGAILIDKKNRELVEKYVWSIRKNRSDFDVVLATIPVTKNTIKLSRLIMGNPKGKIVFHINGDRLDNRECNLRIGTYSELQKTFV